ncbi:putative nephrocystin-4, partial [Triplophysa rosa]
MRPNDDRFFPLNLKVPFACVTCRESNWIRGLLCLFVVISIVFNTNLPDPHQSGFSHSTETAFTPRCPGLQLQYRVDPQFLKPGERVWFLRYLALHSLQIDVWDSESLMLIGSTAVELKHMLRQGRAAVQVCHELEVITTEYLQDASCDGKHGAFPPINVYTTVKGILHLRLGNVGGSVSSSQSSLALPPAHSHVVLPSDAARGLAGGSVPAFTVLKLN